MKASYKLPLTAHGNMEHCQDFSTSLAKIWYRAENLCGLNEREPDGL